MSATCGITTKDNPFDQFTDFRSWFLFDIEKGYNTSGLLARMLQVSEVLTDEEVNELVEAAVDRIIELDFEGKYEKVYEKQDKTTPT